MRFKKLLVGIDFSPPSREALHTAIAMAADSGAELVLAHVWQPHAHTYGDRNDSKLGDPGVPIA